MGYKFIFFLYTDISMSFWYFGAVAGTIVKVYDHLVAIGNKLISYASNYKSISYQSETSEISMSTATARWQRYTLKKV